MLSDMIEDLINAKNKKDEERAFKRLEKVGVDRRTAKFVANEIRNHAKRQ